ncbi:MAG: serpin family protein [Gemmatimonadaceae bacterium]|nr:serpin family protein [Gemmatimonadaceae bacterium]
MYARSILTRVVIVLFTGACGTSAPTGTPAELTALPRPLTNVESQLVARSNRFTFTLLKRVDDDPSENLFLSPLSVSMALGMTMNGAANTTLDSMRTALGVDGLSREEINAGYRGLIDLLLGLDATTQMRVANSVWVRQGLTADPAFVSAVGSSFDADVRTLDFASASAVNTVNSWVAEATNDRIPKVLDVIRDEDVMFLINALYFKGKWREPFDPKRTVDGPFTPETGAPQTARMMNAERVPIRVARGPASTVGELPYGNGAFTMAIVLPDEGVSLATVVDSLDDARWAAITASLAPQQMDVSMPRFTMRYSSSLNTALQALGMGIAFEDGRADFRQLFTPNEPGPFISFVQHDAFVAVDEVGTEAAAVTTVGVGVTSLPPSFRVDRPFLFMVRERLSGTIVFVGRVARVPE